MTAAAMSSVAAGPSIRSERGRTRISAKALNRVVAAVTADTFGVPASAIGVDLADENGMLVLTVSTPIRVPSLDRIRTDPGAVERAGGTVLGRAARAHDVIRDRVTGLTGSAISRVVVRLKAADIQKEERVR